jgi:alkane 1-monooxygenase
MQWRALKYLIPLLMFASIYRSFHATGWIVFIPLIIAFGLLPLFESLIRPDPSNLDAAEEAIASKSIAYDLLLYIVVPLQYFALYNFLLSIQHGGLQWWEIVGRIAVMGLSCSVFGINVGHELGHRNTWYEQWMAKALLLTSLYTQFYIEHNKGHHKHVSTPGDPSSAPYRMSLYRFWFRSIAGVYTGAWRIANEEMRKQNLPAFHWRNEMLQLQMLSIAWVAVIYWQFGGWVTIYYLVAATIGVLLLETVNYIEHYGLARNETAPGKFERAMPWHSWNSNHIFGRLMLFELSRHSDHHYLASRKYQILRHHDDAPQLPTGYPGSMLMATIPPLWFYIMDKQMDKYNIEHNKKQAA